MVPSQNMAAGTACPPGALGGGGGGVPCRGGVLERETLGLRERVR